MELYSEIGTVPLTEEARIQTLSTLLPAGRAGMLRWPEKVDSTFRELRVLAEAGAPAGSAVLAEKQTAGRGRLGRSFASPPGGLYLCYLLRPSEAPDALGELTALTAVAVRRAVHKACGLAPEIKWVNDLMLEGKKLCGILAEAVIREGKAESVILGIGVNVETRMENFPPELRETAVSLRQVMKTPPDRLRLAAAVLEELDALARSFPAERGEYLAQYRSACLTVGKRVTLTDGTEGFAEGLGEDFSLLLRLGDGSLRQVRSGEASMHLEEVISNR